MFDQNLRDYLDEDYKRLEFRIRAISTGATTYEKEEQFENYLSNVKSGNGFIDEETNNFDKIQENMVDFYYINSPDCFFNKKNNDTLNHIDYKPYSDFFDFNSNYRDEEFIEDIKKREIDNFDIQVCTENLDVTESKPTENNFPVQQQNNTTKSNSIENSSVKLFKTEYISQVKTKGKYKENKNKRQKNNRKYDLDCLQKKFKVKCWDYIRKDLNSKIKKFCQGFKGRLRKLPQSFLGSINLKTDKQALFMTNAQIFKHEFKFNTKSETNVNKEEPNNNKCKLNKDIINKIENTTNLKTLLETKVIDMINQYLTSDQYIYDLEQIKSKNHKDGEFYGMCYDQIAKGYINYITETNPYKKVYK